MPNCYTCNEPIEFSDLVTSANTGKKIPLDPNGEPHNCSGRTSYQILHCNSCDQEITFSDDYVSSRGKKIPLDAMSESPHECINRRQYYPCKNHCGSEIYFSKKDHDANGKWRPFDKVTDIPHLCINDPYNNLS